MSDGLETTFRLLEKTGNEAAVRALVPALDSPDAPIREGALAALLSRRSPAGHREVLRRLDRLDKRSQRIVEARQGRMTRAMRDAVLGSDPHLCANGCRAAVRFRQCDLIPALINALENESNPNGPVVGKTLLELVELLYGELADPGDQQGRSDPERIRRHVITALERSVERFPRHRRWGILRAFLLLANRDNVVLKRVLENPHHAAFLALVHILSNSPAAGVIGLLLTFLDDPRAPSAVLSVVSNRGDLKFVRHLLRKIGQEPAGAVKQNLKRIESVAWLRKGTALLDQLDNAAQHAAVRLAMTSGVPRGQAFDAVQHLLLHGKPMGRRAAAEALSEFNGAEANALVVRALEDEDPQVQANVLGQLRHRGILGALPRLLEMVDSPHAVVREAARASLNEFSFQRYLAAFDMLDDEVRQSVGKLVKKIDPQTIPQLQAELGSSLRTRRLRALAIAPVIQAVPPVEGMIVRLLQDDDHLVRAEAARALAQGKLRVSWEGLQQALYDPNAFVREAAQKSIRDRTRPRRQGAGDDGPDSRGQAR